MNITVRYFAALKEQAGISCEALDIAPITVEELYQKLAIQHHFSLNKKDIKAAVNDSFVSMNYCLKENDQVVFIPPVAGG